MDTDTDTDTEQLECDFCRDGRHEYCTDDGRHESCTDDGRRGSTRACECARSTHGPNGIGVV